MDEARLHEFMGKLVGDMGAAATLANVVLGDELGLYRAMADSQPVSPEVLAERTGCQPRLVREWLNGQAAAGYVVHDHGNFTLPEEQAMTLALEDSPAYMAGGAAVLAALFHDKDKLVKAMRGDGALAWGDHHPCMFSGTERFFRPGYRTFLVADWLPALEGVVGKLQAGAQVADVGCGHGASTIVMAQAFPQSHFVGYDYHAPSVATATERAREAGVGGQVSFQQASAKDYPGHDLDLVCFFDCLHDMGDPVGAARHAYKTLKADGTVMLVEPFAEDSLDANINPVGRLFYAASTFICTPNSLSQEVGLGLGAQAGEARLRAVFEEAGFSRFRRATQTPFNLILEARK
ncbi:class I SAM-dependent methyltransferase [Pseudomonas sp. zfem004]|uniref:class I SAM-dependent methyltransferase n=1 Tax=Pseudomonas sp. zfem004 TaxID=3078199 RepID=UPI0029297242|nr:class I SAM-dependent methyltransferase [Pseudomonas sp. zfem004]MDU9403441.1 class I SAM-dependent methyltransferase [Pseudomonas sp. zfem004]